MEDARTVCPGPLELLALPVAFEVAHAELIAAAAESQEAMIDAGLSEPERGAVFAGFEILALQLGVHP